jgi:hypothetical protein
MIDGIKILRLPINIDGLIKNCLLVWPLSNISIDGEFINRPQVAEYNGIRFILKNSNVKLSGSLHKYSNRGLHNYNDFYVNDLTSVINEICDKFSFDSKEAELNGVEFGINVNIPCTPQIFIDSIIHYKGTPFERMNINGKGYGRECIKDNFIIKCYDKSLQYLLPGNVLRFEIKVIKMRFFEDNGIILKTLNDLKNIEIYPGLSSILTRYFEELLVYNQNSDISKLSDEQQNLILRGSNPLYWLERRQNIAQNSAKRKSYQRELLQFKTLIETIGGDKYKNEILNSIKSKCTELINVPNSPIEKCPKFTEIDVPNSPVINKGCPEITFKIKCEKWTSPKLYLVCPITKLKIYNQKPGSKFLSISGIKYLYEHQLPVFERLKNERLTSKWKEESLSIQIREIAHSIRNEYYNPKNNPRNNTKKSIVKIYSYPVLFETSHLIIPEKRRIAGL